MLPPLGFGAMLPVARRRCIHLIAELALTSNHSAASRREAPDSTASTTRSRNSKEHGFGIDALQNSNQCHQIRLSKSSGESQFNPAEIRSSLLAVGTYYLSKLLTADYERLALWPDGSASRSQL